MKKLFKAMAIALAATSVFAFASCGSKTKKSEDVNAGAPDYSQTGDEYTLFAYHGVRHNWYSSNATGLQTLPETLMTKEKLQEYKDAGFNVLFCNYVFDYNGELDRTVSNGQPTSISVLDIMDMAQELGLKVFVSEQNIRRLGGLSGTLIDETAPAGANGAAPSVFNSEADLQAYVRRILGKLAEHPAFYGVSIKDEPTYGMLPVYGEIYKAIKACYPNAYVHANLLPMTATAEYRYAENGRSKGLENSYREYLSDFYKYSNADCINYDDYPILGNNSDQATIKTEHLRNAQIVAEFCKEKGLRYQKVFQTCSFKTGSWICRTPTQTDMYWQTNIGMAMGVKTYSYWSYYPVTKSGGETYVETASFLNQKGEKNQLYYWMQDIHAEMQGTAEALMNFEYQGLRTYKMSPMPGVFGYIAGLENNDLKYVSEVTQSSNGIILVTELYDKDEDQYGYYVVNVTDPTQSTEIDVTVKFDEFTKVQTYSKGEPTNSFLKGGATTFSLATGQGVFLLPY